MAEASRPGSPGSLQLDKPTLAQKLKLLLVGGPRNVEDPRVFHRIALMAFLAWVGLGADGLSSSAYGPEEAFKALGEHKYLAVVLALATAFTVFIIATAYTRIIEHFPSGGGGYFVASRLLGARAGVVAGSALIIDYVLTITISISAGADAVFSFLPETWHLFKVPVACFVIVALVVMNLRGVKESVTILTPIFLTFVITHAILIIGALITRGNEVPVVVGQVREGFSSGFATIGLGGLLMLFMRSYSMGAGTYTGIEAVSNGLMIMQDPKVETGKRTMKLMAVSLAVTAGAIIIAYLLLGISPEPGKTMNAVLVERFAGSFDLFGIPVGQAFVWLTLGAEALLLFVAAQTGFIDGPRVMSNVAIDSYLPRRFAQLSDRLTTHHGILLMGAASVAALLYTGGDVGQLVVMYAINVFLTFSLSQLGMCRFWWRGKEKHANWRRNISIHVIGLILCVFILAMTIYEKFSEGAWKTLLITGLLIAVCLRIRGHYRKVERNLDRLDEHLPDIPKTQEDTPPKPEKTDPTAVLLVNSFAGLGIHSLLSIQRLFPNHFKNFVFMSVGVIDSATFKNIEEVERVRSRTKKGLEEYVDLARRLGLRAEYKLSLGTEVVQEAEELCREVAKEYPRTMFFAGKLVFERERWYQRILHNETAYQLQRRLQFAGLNAMVLPVRVRKKKRVASLQPVAST